MARNRPIDQISILISLAIVLVFCFQCNNKQAERISYERESDSMVSIRNFTRTSYKSDGSLEWTLDAGESFVYPVEDRTILYDLIFRQFEEGKLKSSLEGKRGEVNHTNKELIIKGSIHLITEDKKELFTEELNYNLETKELKSDTDVKILSGGTIIEGRGLRAEKELNRFTILKPKAITRDGMIPFQSK